MLFVAAFGRSLVVGCWSCCVARCLPVVACCVLFVVGRLLVFASGLIMCVVRRLLFVVWCLLPSVCGLRLVVCCSCLLFVVCCLLFVFVLVGCWLFC